MKTKAVLEGLIVVVISLFILGALTVAAWAMPDGDFNFQQLPKVYGIIECVGLLIYGLIRSIGLITDKMSDIKYKR